MHSNVCFVAPGGKELSRCGFVLESPNGKVTDASTIKPKGRPAVTEPSNPSGQKVPLECRNVSACTRQGLLSPTASTPRNFMEASALVDTQKQH
jgi:hypothetical protein